MRVTLNDRELATVLAALRYWQRIGMPFCPPEWDIARDGGALAALSPAEIDLLCERMNLEGRARTPPSDDAEDKSKQAAFTAADKAMTELGLGWQSVVWFDRGGKWTWFVERGSVKVWQNSVGRFNAFHSTGHLAPNCATAENAVKRLDDLMNLNVQAATQ